MERREFMALAGLMLAAAPQQASAGPQLVGTAPGAPAPGSLAERLTGTWSYVSSVNIRGDGTPFDRWGSEAKGIMTFDRSGNYAQIITGVESRIFGSKLFCAFGRFHVKENSKLLVTTIEATSSSRLNGKSQTREIRKLDADELGYFNASASGNTTSEVMWRRIG